MGKVNELPFPDATLEDRIERLELIIFEQSQLLKQVVTNHFPMPNKYGVPQIAAYLDVSKTYVYRLVSAGLLKTFNGENAQVWTTKEELDRCIIEDLPHYNWGKNEYKGKVLELHERKKKVAKMQKVA